MASITLNPSPQDYIPPTPFEQPPDHPIEDADGFAAFIDTGIITSNFSTLLIQLGTAVKGIQRGLVWLMFEIPFPQGTRFSEMSLGLKRNVALGGNNLSLSIGFLATDGTWNKGGESGTGWLEYINIEDVPHPNSPSDAAWLGSSASLSHTIDNADFINGDRYTWGTTTPGLDFDDPKFLTDLQTAFDENEVDRTSRGVPVALALVPDSSANGLVRFEASNRFSSAVPSPEEEGKALGPHLFLRTRRIIVV